MVDEVLFDLLHTEIATTFFQPLDKDEKETSVTRLEHVGFRTGYRLVERLTKDWPRFKDELDTVKFICKEFWSSVFKKQVDNLRTNHQGVYVLQDNYFRLLTQISDSRQYLEMVPKETGYLYLPLRYLNGNLPQHWIGHTGEDDHSLMQWPPRSPDLMPYNYFMKDTIFVPPLSANLMELHNCVTIAVAVFNHDILTQIWDKQPQIDDCTFCKYLAFTCGLIRGALANLGIISVVTAEVELPPNCKFQIQVQRT